MSDFKEAQEYRANVRHTLLFYKSLTSGVKGVMYQMWPLVDELSLVWAILISKGSWICVWRFVVEVKQTDLYKYSLWFWCLILLSLLKLCPPSFNIPFVYVVYLVVCKTYFSKKTKGLMLCVACLNSIYSILDARGLTTPPRGYHPSKQQGNAFFQNP